jgi:hypothetical protein
MTAMMAALLWISQGLALGGEPRQLQLKWSALDPAIAGRKVALVLPGGTHIEGKVLRAEPEGLRLKIAKTSNRKAQPKGERLIPRQSVSVLRYTEYRGIGRLIGTLALPAAVAAGILAGGAGVCYEGPCVILFPALAIGGAGGSAIGGYYIGKRVDKRVTEIRIAREE